MAIARDSTWCRFACARTCWRVVTICATYTPNQFSNAFHCWRWNFVMAHCGYDFRIFPVCQAQYYTCFERQLGSFFITLHFYAQLCLFQTSYTAVYFVYTNFDNDDIAIESYVCHVTGGQQVRKQRKKACYQYSVVRQFRDLLILSL